MKEKVLITGAAGMMGSHCVDLMIDEYSRFFDIYGIDDLSGSYRENLNPKCKFTKLDLRNVKKLGNYFTKHFKQTGLKYVIHFASAAHEIRSFFTPIDNMSRNDVAFRNVLTYALACNVEHVVFFSSMSRYGSGNIYDGNGNIIKNQKVPFKEDYIPSPEDPYACAKVASENLLKAMQNIYDFTYTIWIPHNCFSPRQFVDPYRNVLAIWMNLMLMKKECVIYGTGEQQRAISWVDDFNPIICKSLFNPKTYNQLINIGGDDHKTITEWYELVQKVTGNTYKVAYCMHRPGEIKHAYCNHDKAKKLTGFRNSTSIEDALLEMWKYFKSKGPRKFNYIKNFEINSNKIPIPWKQKSF